MGRDKYSRRRRDRDDSHKRKHKRRRSSSSSDSYERRKHKKEKRKKHRGDDSESDDAREEAKRQARLAKARMLSILQSAGGGLDEEVTQRPPDLVQDDQRLIQEQLRLFHESGLEGEKINVVGGTGETSKSALSNADDSKNNESNIRDENQNGADGIVPDMSQEQAKSSDTGSKKPGSDSIQVPEKPKEKGTFKSMDTPAQPSSSPKLLASLNIGQSQNVAKPKVKDVFGTPEQSPKKEPAKVNFASSALNTPINQSNGADDEEIDPLDAYFATIKDEAAAQSDLGEEDDDKPVENVISFDEIQNLQYDQTESVMDTSNMDSDEDAMEVEKTTKDVSLSDDKYYREFMSKLHKNRATDNQERFFGDDDKYIEEFETRRQQDDDYLEKQKKATEKREFLLSAKKQQLDKLESFQKNFYVVPKEITDMTEEEVEKYRKDLGDVAVRGVQCPRPVKSWYHCGLTQRVMSVLKKKGFESPRPIQCQAIPAIMGGRDVIGIAETGSGKTLAYLLPMFRHILNQRPLKEGEGMIGLVMAPTRELAQQIYLEAKSFARILNLTVVCVYGGAEVGSQLSQLKRGAEIVVCTPGRMIDVLTTNGGKFTNLHRVTYLVLDEADRMLDMGFEPQISRIIGGTRSDRQTVMFSATFPKTIGDLARRILSSPLEIVVGNRGQACKDIEQFVKIVNEEDKIPELVNLIDQWIGEGSIIIFVDSQAEADDLFKKLFDLKYELFVLHGGIDHTDREYTISDFKKGVRKIMVATSIAARGLDIKAIRVVINYKCPNHMEDYIHRIGRTGRAGNKGTAYTFITQDEEHYAGDLIKALKTSEQPIEEDLIKLYEEYQQKVREGKAEYRKKYTVKSGRGYDYSEEARKKYAEEKKNMEKGLYIEGADDISDSEIDIKNAADRQSETIQLSDSRLVELARDPKARRHAKEAAEKATKKALNDGLPAEKVLELADKALIQALSEYKPQSKLEKGIEQAMQIRDKFMDRESEQNNHFSYNLEINDYPQQARIKVCSRDFLSSIYDLTNCNVSVRGTYTEPGKNVPLGQKKQYLYIEGGSKLEVTNAYKELKRVLEENAASSFASGMSGSTGRYNVI